VWAFFALQNIFQYLRHILYPQMPEIQKLFLPQKFVLPFFCPAVFFDQKFCPINKKVGNR
jgi:hypothetical protein